MHWLWYVLIFFLVLLILVILSEIKIKINFNKEKKNDYLKIDVWVFYNLIHIKKNIPLIAFESFEEGIKYKSDTNATGVENKEKKDRITPEKFFRWRRQFKKLLKKINHFGMVMRKFLKHVEVDLYSWETLIGTGDAMVTGLASGLIWQIKGFSLGFLSKFMRLNKEPSLKVDSDFNREVFKSEFTCILKFRLGYFIITGIRLIKLYIGGEKIGRRSSYSRLNENRYGKFKGNG